MYPTTKKAIKVIGLFFIISCILMLYNSNTYAFFFKNFQQYLGITSASAENLIKYVEIKEQEDKSLVIEIIRDSNYGYRPDVGFEIEGDIEEYIVHINPVKIDRNGIYEIPIDFNINTHQFLELLWMKTIENKENVIGSITVKNFDGKTIDSKKIEININYLLSRIDEDLQKNKDISFQGINNEQVKMEVSSLVNGIASQINWNEERLRTKNPTSGNTDFILSPYQSSMISTISPNLIGHLNMLQSEIKEVNQDRERLNQEIASLIKKNNEKQSSLEKNVEQLQEENEKLRKMIESQIDSPDESNSEQSSEGTLDSEN